MGKLLCVAVLGGKPIIRASKSAGERPAKTLAKIFYGKIRYPRSPCHTLPVLCAPVPLPMVMRGSVKALVVRISSNNPSIVPFPSNHIISNFDIRGFGSFRLSPLNCFTELVGYNSKENRRTIQPGKPFFECAISSARPCG